MSDAIDSGVTSDKEVKGLTAWANGYLKKREFPAVDNCSQFADGVLLINLLELTFKQELPRYTARPKLPIQKLENVSVACDFIIKEKIMMLGLDPHDIVAKKEKQIVIALWNILRTVLLRGLGQDDDQSNGKLTFRERLLKYFSENFPNLKITDFWKCWQDGIAFCHVVNRLCPGKIDVKSLKSKNKSANLQEAFDVAQWELGIPRMIEPDEMQSKSSNEKACMNYISMLLSAAQSAEQQTARDAEAERIKQRLKDMQNDAAKMQAEKERLEREQAEQQAEKERLRAEMEAAASKSDAERNAMASKFDELQRQMAQAAAEREAMAAAKAAMEKESQSDRASLLEEIERLKADIISLNSQLYQAHNELEEVVVRVAKDRSVKLAEERGGGTVTRDRSHSTKLRATQREAKTATEYLDDMAVKEGVLMRRRPGATFNKDRFKEVWFSLKGNKLMYKRKNGVVNGEFPLELYEAAYIIDEDAEDGGKSKKKEDTMDSEPSKERFAFRLEPRPDEKKKKKNRNMFVELQARECDEQDKRDVNAATRRWMWEINRRIAIHDYLRMLDETSEPGCRELLDYVTDDNNDTMAITDKVVGASSFQALFPALLQRQSLRTIRFKNAEVNDKVCGLIAQVVKENEHIKTVALPGNLITVVGVKSLVTALRRNISVTALDLSNNKLRDDGVKALSEVFADHANLESVNLSGNGITDDGVKYFVEGMLKSTKENNGSVHYLPHVDLSYNLVGDDGCEQLKRLCELNNTILSINLESNKIADAGGVSLAACITGDGADLDTLNVAGNDLAAKGVMALAAAIKDSDGEVQVDISDNKLISRKGYAAILEMPCNMEFVLLKFRKLIADESTVKHQRQATMNDRSMSFSGFKPVEDKTQPRPSLIPAGTKLPEFSEEEESDDDDDARPSTAIQEETGDLPDSDDDGVPMPAAPPSDSDDDSDAGKPPMPGADFSSDSD